MAMQNRRDIFDPNEVGCFHAVQRTVRRAWLFGSHPVSGKSFQHRRSWIQNRLQELDASVGIDCLSFAVMVNHVHVILRNRPDIVVAGLMRKLLSVGGSCFRFGRTRTRVLLSPLRVNSNCG